MIKYILLRNGFLFISNVIVDPVILALLTMQGIAIYISRINVSPKCVCGTFFLLEIMLLTMNSRFGSLDSDKHVETFSSKLFLG